MNNLKLYELIKSNEPNSTILYYELQKLKKEAPATNFTFITAMIEALFSTLIANELSTIHNIINSNDPIGIIIISILVLFIIFIAIFLELHFIVLLIREFLIKIKNNKSSDFDRKFLEEIIYKDIINNLMTAQSLCSKSPNNNDFNSDKLRYYETMYYLYRVIDIIEENQIVLNVPDDISKKNLSKRQRDYVEFILQVDKELLCDILNIVKDISNKICQLTRCPNYISYRCKSLKRKINVYIKHLNHIESTEYYKYLKRKFESEASTNSIDDN